MRRARSLVMVAAGSSVLLSLALTPASAQPGSGLAVTPGPTTAPSVSFADDVVFSEEEAANLPSYSAETSDLASGLTAEFSADPRFSSAEVPDGTDEIVVHWYGEPSAALLDRLAGSAVEASISGTTYRAGDLVEEANRLMDLFPVITQVNLEPDASGLTVLLDPNAPQSRGLPSNVSLIDSVTTVPLEFDVGEAVPTAASRSFDEYHLGGALINGYVGGLIQGRCTSGFAVRNNADPSRQGMMTAGHCGQVGKTWVLYNGGSTAQQYGTTVARSTIYDGAIIDSTYSSPGVYFGGVNSTTYAKINGAKSPFVGQKLCYGGSFSGTKCGNNVDGRRIYEFPNTDQSRIEGWITSSADGKAVVGNGDSGGPAYEAIAGTPNTRWAVGIISAIPGDSTAAACDDTGTPGGNGRKCSSTVYFTSAVLISNDLDWGVPAQS